MSGDVSEHLRSTNLANTAAHPANKPGGPELLASGLLLL